MADGEVPVFKLFGKTIEPDKRLPSSSEEECTTPQESAADEQQQMPAEAGPKSTAAAAAEAAAGRCLPCPRCRSRETKFCYFNNYNVNQPRHFCKACHRYWTAGGALRNVPIGAGRRKNRAPPPSQPAGR